MLNSVEFYKQIGSNLSKVMKNRNITQKNLAKELGVSIMCVHKWTHGISAPEYYNLYRLCSVLECDYSDILPNV